MKNFIHESIFALRGLRRQPSFFAIIVSVIALTVGTNGLIFGLVLGVLLRPLPYDQPEKLVVIWEENLRQGYHHNTVALPNFEDWKREARSFEAFAAWKHEEDVLATDADPERLVGSTVTSDFFAALGVRPLLGRTFGPEEEAEKAAVVLISEGLWRRRFGGSQEIVGRRVVLDGEPFTILGVLPAGFDRPLESLLNKSDFWRPMTVDPPRGTRFLHVIGRVSGDPAAAQTELSNIAGRLAEQYPENAGWTVRLVPLHEELVHTVRPVLQILFIAANVVLLIGCTNLANILLARAASRESEIALRLSLGATRWRLFSLFAAESLVLVLPGSLLGALLTWMGGRLLTREYFQFLPRIGEIDLGGPVLCFALLLALIATLGTALLVMAQVSRLDLGKSVAEMSRRSGAGRGTRRMREGLAVLQVVLTFPLLVSTFLLIQSVRRLEEVDLGFEPQSVVAGEVSLPSTRYGVPASQAQFFRELLGNLQGAPGVEARSAISDLPLSEWDTGVEFVPAGIIPGPGEKTPSGQLRIIAPDYFRTMRIERKRGRDFDERDRNGAEPVLVVNEELARRFFPDRNPVGERLAVRYFDKPFQGRIVGMVADVRHGGPADELQPTIYANYLQLPVRRMTILVRSAAGTEAIAETLRQEIRRLDTGLPPAKLARLEALYEEATAGARLRALVLGLFGALAIALAALGIYGVVSFSTAIRRHEIGVRMALGAQRREILLMILRHGTLLCLWGIAGGAVLELGASRFLAEHLYGVSVLDVSTWALVAGLLVFIGVGASLKPATGAVRLAPALVLKSE